MYGDCITGGGVGGIDAPFCFAGNLGAHQTITNPIVDNGDGTLDFSGLSVKWAGADVPLYGGVATLNCSAIPCTPSDNYIIDYVTTIPSGPFTGITYTLHLVGAPVIPQANISINVAGGANQECSETGGSTVSFTANVHMPDDDSINTIQWQVDGVEVSTGGDL